MLYTAKIRHVPKITIHSSVPQLLNGITLLSYQFETCCFSSQIHELHCFHADAAPKVGTLGNAQLLSLDSGITCICYQDQRWGTSNPCVFKWPVTGFWMYMHQMP